MGWTQELTNQFTSIDEIQNTSGCMFFTCSGMMSHMRSTSSLRLLRLAFNISSYTCSMLVQTAWGDKYSCAISVIWMASMTPSSVVTSKNKNHWSKVHLKLTLISVEQNRIYLFCFWKILYKGKFNVGYSNITYTTSRKETRPTSCQYIWSCINNDSLWLVKMHLKAILDK